MQFKTRTGVHVTVDAGEERCRAWGFGSGDVIRDPSGRTGQVRGHGEVDRPFRGVVLWYQRDDEDSVCYFGGVRDEPTDLKEEGFELVEAYSDPEADLLTDNFSVVFDLPKGR